MHVVDWLKGQVNVAAMAHFSRLETHLELPKDMPRKISSKNDRG